MKKQGNNFYRGTRVSDIRNQARTNAFTDSAQTESMNADGANIAGVPIDEPYTLGNDATDASATSGGNEPYVPRHLSPDEESSSDDRRKGDDIPQPDGSHVAPNGAVIQNPWSEQPEIKPDYEYTSEKEDLNLMIM